MKRILILASTTGYQTRVFEETARRIGYEPVMATDRCRHLDDPWGDHALAVRFQEPEAGAAILSRLVPPPDGVVAVGDKPTEIAAIVAERLGLRFHPRASVLACRNKFLTRERFREAGLPVPDYYRVALHTDLGEAVRSATFPCVLKPLGLSGSRGVIRADSESEFFEAFQRICDILDQPDVRRLHDEQDRFLQVESYIPGREFALEGLVTGGKLRTLALFDKPDPLEGPFFEETLYVAPSREPEDVQLAIRQAAQKAVSALGMTDGPLHAEMRVNDQGVWMLEAAARPIGGLCAKAIRLTGGMSLEELLLRAAVGEDVSGVGSEDGASGVMMLPVPRAGVYRGVTGVDEAEAVAGITEVVITAKEGQRMVPPPEGASYPGFLFARAGSPEAVEAALRESQARLRFEISTELPAMRPGA